MDAIKNAMSGNAFSAKSWEVDGGQRVWREIRHRFPGGAKISNLSTYATSAGSVIPAGTPVTLEATDNDGKTVTVYTTMPTAWVASKAYSKGALVSKDGKIYKANAAIASSVSTFDTASWTEQTIDGFTQDDVVVDSDTTTATVTVVYAGELYAYMYDATFLALLKGVKPAEIQFVY